MGSEEHLWEVGSEFHWMGIPTGPVLSWPQPNAMFALGRLVINAIHINNKKKGGAKNLFVPDYFCADVLAYWRLQGFTIIRYPDNPTLSCPQWDGQDVEAGDMVLAVNYFGIRNGNFWNAWQQAHEGVILIEDHSHDPLSTWALNSNADYAFASLRKTMPVPDGAILWSPRKRALPSEFSENNWNASSLKLAAMILKKEYLQGADERLKDCYRSFEIEGEKIYSELKEIGISPWSRFLLEKGCPASWRKMREENVKLFFLLIRGQSSLLPLFTSWPEGHCPLNAILLFPSEALREMIRERCLKNNIYVSVHWPQDRDASPEAHDIARRILTIPVDFRYGPEDIERIVAIIK